MSLVALASVALLTPMVVVALWNLVAAPRLERAPPGRTLSRVSLLVPARNEALNLRETLPALLALEDPALEILVLDDGSEDGTAALVAGHLQRSGGRLRLLRGRPRPGGWLGKNWACHQLAGAATGDLLVFCDADVTVGPRALAHTRGAMEAAGAAVLTALPRQRFGDWVESAVVPLVAQLPVLALLPLPLVPRLPNASLSMANGQWLAFTRDAYQGCGGHAAVRDQVIEDVALGRRAKAAGYRLLPLVSHSLLSVRMYRGAAAVREGFGKNLHALTGGRTLSFVPALLVFALTAVYPWAGAAVGDRGALPALALLMVLRVCGTMLFRHGIRAVLLHPVGSVVVMALAIESWVGARRGTLRWKGRGLDAGRAAEPSIAPAAGVSGGAGIRR